MLEPRIVLITGERQIGKSTACTRLVEILQEQRLQVSGLITRRTGPDDLQVTELRSGETYPLTVSRASDEGIPVGHFRMDDVAMARSAKALDASFPTQIFILDEIGPLELVQGKGWARALKLLKRFEYDVAFVVIRPELLVHAVWQLPASYYTVVHVTRDIRDAVPISLLRIATESCALPEYEHTRG